MSDVEILPLREFTINGISITVLARPAVLMDEIKSEVARHYGLTVDELIAPTHLRRIARPRQFAMWLSKRLTRRSYPEIGERFGGKDHTTVMSGERNIEKLINEGAEELEIALKLLSKFPNVVFGDGYSPEQADSTP